MTLSDRTLGGCLLFLNVLLFAYYTIWALFTPFLPTSSPLFLLFPLSRKWAIRIPVLILLFGLCFVGMVTGFVMIETAKRNGQSTSRVRAAQKGRKVSWNKAVTGLRTSNALHTS
ncbi:hypothetical protein JCM6882_001618 [Rhodosporidiobolus microsporus]